MAATKTALPRYIQIADWLRGRVESGELGPGAKLASERDLCRQLGVTRPTLRQALLTLETEGLLARRRGAGTFVAEPKIDRDAVHLRPFTRAMQQQGLAPGARVLSIGSEPASASIAQKLRLPLGEKVFSCCRVRLIGDEPMMIERTYLPAHRFPGFDALDLTHRSIYETLEAHYGVTIPRADQTLEAVTATAQEAKWLGVLPGDALLLERRVAQDANGVPVEYAKDLYRGDRFRFVAHVEL